jgi:hypothetical protein
LYSNLNENEVGNDDIQQCVHHHGTAAVCSVWLFPL